MSVANLTYDQERGQYQLDLRMFMDDFLVVTGVIDDDASPYGELLVAPTKNSVKKYLAEHFFIFFNGKSLNLKVDKVKIEELTIYVTFDIDTDIFPKELREVKIADTIYADQFINQRNIVHINLPGKKRKSLLFNQYQREEVAKWSD
ncbi:MAG: hypothetical protein HKN76_15840 [Saprospiraceae bacterium]|nr:hypothetical protein [Saprospiraceae bacterium]